MTKVWIRKVRQVQERIEMVDTFDPKRPSPNDKSLATSEINAVLTVPKEDPRIEQMEEWREATDTEVMLFNQMKKHKRR